MKDLEERKCPEYGCSTDDKSEPDFISIDDIIEQNEEKKKINLGQIGSTVSEKVSAASSTVTSGVDVSAFLDRKGKDIGDRDIG